MSCFYVYNMYICRYIRHRGRWAYTGIEEYHMVGTHVCTLHCSVNLQWSWTSWPHSVKSVHIMEPELTPSDHARVRKCKQRASANFGQPHFNWLSHLSFTSTPNHAYQYVFSACVRHRHCTCIFPVITAWTRVGEGQLP